MIKKILVIGKTGQLGLSIKKISTNYPEFSFIFVGRSEINLESRESVKNYFSDKKFDFILNCSAYTSVDNAEIEKNIAESINNTAVKYLAEISKESGAVLIHISTDYVFSGKSYKPYHESDPTYPLGAYGETKLKGEQAIKEINPYGFIVRTSWLYSEFGNNFLKKMLKLSHKKNLEVVFDQIGTPTYATDLAKAILDLSKLFKKNPSKKIEVYHYSNEGTCSWYVFAKEIFKKTHSDCKVTPIKSCSYHTLAKRPSFSVLNKDKFKKKTGAYIPHWTDSLSRCLKSTHTHNY